MFGGFVANMVNKVVGRPFFNPNYAGEECNIDTLRFFLSEENKDVIVQCLKNLESAAKKENLSINNYIGGTEESVLYLVREIMDVKHRKRENLPRQKVELNFFKSLLAANSITLSKGKGKASLSTEDLELDLALTFISQFGSVDFLYTNRQLLMMSQTIKCIRFFEYAINDAMMGPLVGEFCKKYGVSNWWIYPKVIWSLYALTDGKAGIISMADASIAEGPEYLSTIEALSIGCNERIPKSDNKDYVVFRAKPLVKIADKKYVVFNFQLLIERIYNGLYFDFKELALRRNINLDDFRRHFSTDFSERTLFCGVLKTIFSKDFDVAMDESACLRADRSGDASSASPPDFYARKGNKVFLFENKDILLSGIIKENGTREDYIDFFRTRLYRNKEGKAKGILQLMNTIKKIRTGEFQRRWDMSCPQNAEVYPILVVPEVKFTMPGIKNLLQRWQDESGISMNNVKPIALADIGTLSLYQYELSNNGISSYLDNYYIQSVFSRFEENKDCNDLPNVLMSFSDYLCHTENGTLEKFAREWESYITKTTS